MNTRPFPKTPEISRLLPGRPYSSLARAGFVFTLLAGLGLGSQGCVKLVPYAPSENKLESMGEDAARTRFGELLTQSRDPFYAQGEIDRDKLTVQAQVGTVGWGWWGAGPGNMSRTIYLNNISNIELYDNNVVFIRDLSNAIVLKATFPSPDVAREFVDVVWSFKTAESPG